VGRDSGTAARAVIEDDDDLRGLIRAALDDAGFAAFDLNLPRLGGQAFAAAYRRGTGRAKIIVMSGAADGGEASARVQATVFLSKPFELEGLVGAVRRVLRPAPA
jgi:DNA-binding response OmpR family regulator